MSDTGAVIYISYARLLLNLSNGFIIMFSFTDIVCKYVQAFGDN